MSTFVRAALFALFAGLAGCTLFIGGEDPLPSTVLMPLDVGNKWTYTVSERKVVVATETWEVTRALALGGTTYAEVVKTNQRVPNGRVTVDTVYALNRADGLWIGARRAGTPPPSGGTFFKYPVAGGSFFYNPTVKTCAAAAQGVDVPAGTFDGVIYERCEGVVTHRDFYTPSVGMVFSGLFEGTLYTLASYEVAAGEVGAVTE